MQQILAGITWVQNNWLQIAQAITGVIGVASIIVKLTPSPKDDNVLSGIIKFVSKYIALNKNISEADKPK